MKRPDKLQIWILENWSKYADFLETENAELKKELKYWKEDCTRYCPKCSIYKAQEDD